MTKQLLICIALFCGTPMALAQQVFVLPPSSGGCGFERDTDLDGQYVSSTSTDQCSNVALPRASAVDPLLPRPNYIHDTRLIFPKLGFSGTLAGTLTQFDSLTLPKRFKDVAQSETLLLMEARRQWFHLDTSAFAYSDLWKVPSIFRTGNSMIEVEVGPISLIF